MSSTVLSPVHEISQKKSNHRANIIRINTIISHRNADNLEIVLISGYQAVVRKGDFKIGDLAVYIQPDSVVPQTEPFRFIWEPYAGPRYEDENRVISYPDGLVPEKKRRITVRKFRGEWSEGLLLPLSEFDKMFWYDPTQPTGKMSRPIDEGDDVSDCLGITHYDPDAGKESTDKGAVSHAPRRKYPKTLKGWFFFLLHKLRLRKNTSYFVDAVNFKLPIYDVESYKNYLSAFEEGEPVVVTEKIHGSNARFVCVDGVMYAGSRERWKSPDSNCVWRKALKTIPWIEEWCRAHEGHALYGEITPTQGKFDYGCGKGQVRFFLFDILNPNGNWVPYGQWGNLGMWPNETVPVLYFGPFSKERILSLVDGMSCAPGVAHMREGIVVKALDENQHVRGLGRLQLKLVSNSFLDKDSK